MRTKAKGKRRVSVRPAGKRYWTGQAALKIILFGGVVVFGLLLLLASALRQSLARDESQRVVVQAPQSPFDGKRAFSDLERVVAFGPRPPGSPALEQLRGFIRAELKDAGLTVREQAFDATTPIGTRHMVNLIGVVEGTEPGVILIGNHYDTKYFPTINFVGANDGGSTTAWMLELARALGPKREGHTLWLTFFDGEEAFVQWSDSDSLYGSRHCVEELKQRGALASIQAMINVDMIGDCYLSVERDGGAPRWMLDTLWSAAADLGYQKNFVEKTITVEDDHVPFRNAGIPSIDLIDFMYGGTILDHARYWHTPLDNLDAVCAGSLQVVGDVVCWALPRLDTELDGRKKP